MCFERFLKQNKKKIYYSSVYLIIVSMSIKIYLKYTILLGPDLNEIDPFLPLSTPDWRGIVVKARAGGRAVSNIAEPISL